MFYRKYFKRFLDIVLSGAAIIVLSPLLLVIALTVRISIGKPVLFKQQRPGKNEKIFTILKFRTMSDKRDESGELLPDEYRCTKVGTFLRAASLDELPELFNIFKGDMSIVGPRPLLVEYLPLYNEQQKHRHDVKPGLTGWAQINGRNNLTWEDKFQLDVAYIEKISMLFDIKIIFHTVLNVLKREGINNQGAATVYKFTGTPEREHINE